MKELTNQGVKTPTITMSVQFSQIQTALQNITSICHIDDIMLIRQDEQEACWNLIGHVLWRVGDRPCENSGTWLLSKGFQGSKMFQDVASKVKTNCYILHFFIQREKQCLVNFFCLLYATHSTQEHCLSPYRVAPPFLQFQLPTVNDGQKILNGEVHLMGK